MIARIVAAGCFLTLIPASSCNLDPCKDFACVNGDPQEDYNNCICICHSGWSGSDCTIEDKCITRNIRCLNCPNNDCCNSEEGTCNCLTGYEGDSCQIFSRDRFLNNNGNDSSNWKFNDTCVLQAFSDTVNIKAGSSNTSLEVYNIRNIDATVPVKVNVNKLSFTMSGTVIIDSDTIIGLRGTLTADQQLIRVTYRVNTGNCSGTWLRL